MTKIDIKDRLEKIVTGNYEELDETITKFWIVQLHRDKVNNPSEEQLNLAGEKIWDRLQRNAAPDNHIFFKRKRTKFWPKFTVAASILAFAFAIAFYYYSPREINSGVRLMAANDILPGRSGATLILGNGKKIRLTNSKDGLIAEEAGSRIAKTGSGHLVYQTNSENNGTASWNTLTTARGETYMVVLPDGSKVWLNAASSISYSSALVKEGIRKVNLSGEAYFEVTKDSKHPFIVECRDQQIKVLGTHFNVKSYEEDALSKTTLFEGKVNISTATQNSSLKPGEQAITESGILQVKEADLDHALAWKNGQFLFNDESITEIMRTVSRWYDVRVVYVNARQQELFGGGISRYENISKVLSKLEKTGGVHFKIEGKTVYVYK